VLFVETAAFTRRVTTLLAADEYRALQAALLVDPKYPAPQIR